MRKILTILAVISLSACSTAYHQGAQNIGAISPTIMASPLEVDIVPGKEVKASATCTSHLFGLFSSEPNELAFGPELIETSGNFGSVVCTKGALHKALKSSGADVILMPRYSVKGETFLCLPFIDRCLINKSTVTIKGIAGKYENIKKSNPETSEKIKVKLASETKKPTLSGGFLSF